MLGKKAEALETLKKSFAVGYSNYDWADMDNSVGLVAMTAHLGGYLSGINIPSYAARDSCLRAGYF